MLMCTVLADWALWNNELKACEAVPGCCMLSQYDKSQGRFRISKAVVSTSSKESSTAGTTVRRPGTRAECYEARVYCPHDKSIFH